MTRGLSLVPSYSQFITDIIFNVPKWIFWGHDYRNLRSAEMQRARVSIGVSESCWDRSLEWSEILKQHQKVLETWLESDWVTFSRDQLVKDQMFSKVLGLCEAGSGFRIGNFWELNLGNNRDIFLFFRVSINYCFWEVCRVNTFPFDLWRRCCGVNCPGWPLTSEAPDSLASHGGEWVCHSEIIIWALPDILFPFIQQEIYHGQLARASLSPLGTSWRRGR